MISPDIWNTFPFSEILKDFLEFVRRSGPGSGSDLWVIIVRIKIMIMIIRTRIMTMIIMIMMIILMMIKKVDQWLRSVGHQAALGAEAATAAINVDHLSLR